MASEQLTQVSSVGKFRLAVDEVAYLWSMNDYDNLVGDDQYNGCINLVFDEHFGDRELIEDVVGGLADDDYTFLSRQRGLVTTESTDGTFSAEWFESAEAATNRYDELIPDYALPAGWEC